MQSSAQGPANQSKDQRLQTSLDRPVVNLTSSPVVGANESPTIDSADCTEPQLPTFNQDLTEDQSNNDPSVIQYPNNRREVFRMIESIRSSSPANTPGKLGYDTPVHLRRLRASQATNDIPLTPTLAPTENEEGYIGSSPTPATRDPTPAMNPDAPVSNAHDVAMTDGTDLPSSPPELGSRSPSPQKRSKRSRSERRRSARARKALHRRSLEAQSASNSPAQPDPAAESKADSPQPDASADPNEKNDVHKGVDSPPSRHLRSVLSQASDNDQNLVQAPSIGTPEKLPNSEPAEQNSKSKSGSKRKKRKTSSKTTNEDGRQAAARNESESAPPVAHDPVDSSSEDVETQIASQLEQDLEFAMDMRGNMQEPPEQQVKSPVASRKRKREEDARPSTSKERRRSTRLSSTKEMAVKEPENPDSTQSQDSHVASRPASSAKSTSPTLRRSTRGSQRKEDEPASVIVSPPPVVENSESTQESVLVETSSQPPAKRPRKSLRRQSQSEAATEESSSQLKPTRTRSRTTRSSRNETEPQSQLSQEQVTHTDAASTEVDLFGGQTGEKDVAPASDVQGKTDEPVMPLASTERARDSQMTSMGPSAVAADFAETEKAMNMNVDPIPGQIPAPLLEQVTTTAEVQTDPISPRLKSDTSETGITRSLKKLLNDMRSATLGPQALREVDDLLFNIRVEAHDASRRHKSA